MNWVLLQNSLLLAALTTLLSLVGGLAAALFMAGLNRRGRVVCLGVAVAAFALPPFLVTNSWMRLIGLTGIWRDWFPVDLYSLGGAVLILTLMLWPITALLALASWSRLEPAQFESDPALTGMPLLRWLLLPQAREALAQSAVLTFVLALNNFAVPSLLQVKVFTAEVFVYFNTRFDSLGALAMSWPLILAPMLLLLLVRGRHLAWPRVEGTVSPGIFRRQLGVVPHSLAAITTITLTLLSVGLPLGDLLLDGKTWSELGPALQAGVPAILNSGILAMATAALVATVGLATWRRRLGSWLWLPYLVPGVLLAILLVLLFNRPALAWLYPTASVVVLAWAIRYSAPGWNLVAHAMRARDGDLTDAARLEGASSWQMLRFVSWPQIAPQVGTGLYLTYLLCLWDVETLAILQPPGGETLASRIFGFLHYGHNAQVNALCLTLLFLALAPLLGLGLRRLIRNPGPPDSNPSGFRYRVSLISIPALLLSTGCSPTASNETRVDSGIFQSVRIIGTRGGGLGQFNKPRSLAVDAQDNLYVVDMTGRVQKFSPDGTFLSYWQMPETDKGKPKGMCRDQDGNVVVLEPHYSRVNHYRPDGTLAAQWGRHGTNETELAFPRAVAVNSHGEIYTSEYGLTERVQVFSTNGTRWLRTLGRAGGGPGQFNRPEGLGIDSHDCLYVADSCNHRIQVFSPSGQFLRAHGRPGSGRGEMSYPYDIRVDAAGRQYVCEFGNSRIQIFDAKDQPLEVLGQAGAGPGQFNNPWSIALDSLGNLYVADSLNHRVQKFIRRGSASSQNGSTVRKQEWAADQGQRAADNRQP